MLLEILIAIPVLFMLLYWHVTKNYNHWKDLGVPYEEPKFPFGTMGYRFSRSVNPQDMTKSVYSKFSDSPYYGTFILRRPVLNIIGVDLLRQVLVKDFDHFIDRSNPLNRSGLAKTRVNEAWIKQMVSLSGEEWKNVRY